MFYYPQIHGVSRVSLFAPVWNSLDHAKVMKKARENGPFSLSLSFSSTCEWNEPKSVARLLNVAPGKYLLLPIRGARPCCAW